MPRKCPRSFARNLCHSPIHKYYKQLFLEGVSLLVIEFNNYVACNFCIVAGDIDWKIIMKVVRTKQENDIVLWRDISLNICAISVCFFKD